MLDSNRLELLQITAARIVTGLPVFASHRSPYYKTVGRRLRTGESKENLFLCIRLIMVMHFEIEHIFYQTELMRLLVIILEIETTLKFHSTDCVRTNHLFFRQH